MKTSTENSSENPLETVADKERVSVYSADFTQNINNHSAENEIVLKPLNAQVSEEKKNRSRLSGILFKRRNAIGIAAILAIGILHFAFQLSIIQNEKTQVAENPVKIETIREQPEEIEPAEFEVKKADISLLPKPASLPSKERQIEIAPLKPQLRKKDSAPTKSERLRRAEKILTGI